MWHFDDIVIFPDLDVAGTTTVAYERFTIKLHAQCNVRRQNKLETLSTLTYINYNKLTAFLV